MVEVETELECSKEIPLPCLEELEKIKHRQPLPIEIVHNITLRPTI